MEVHVRIPQIQDIGAAVRLFYEKPVLSNADIVMLFGKGHSSATICRLKKLAREKMIEEDVRIWNARMVDTETAFKAWGLDITSLERRYAKLKKYGFIDNHSAEDGI